MGLKGVLSEYDLEPLWESSNHSTGISLKYSLPEVYSYHIHASRGVMGMAWCHRINEFSHIFYLTNWMRTCTKQIVRTLQLSVSHNLFSFPLLPPLGPKSSTESPWISQWSMYCSQQFSLYKDIDMWSVKSDRMELPFLWVKFGKTLAALQD